MNKTIILAGNLFDGISRDIRKNVLVEIQEGIITAIKDFNINPETEDISNFNNSDNNSALYNLSHCTLLPGLIDCHVHLALDGIDFGKARTLWNHEKELWNRTAQDLQNTISAGIVAVRDGGDLNGIGLTLRNRLCHETQTAPEIIATGYALRKKGKYGSFLGPDLNPEDILPAIEQLAGLGANQIKVLVSGVVSFKEYGKVGELQFTEAELKEIVKGSHDLGLKVMAHASSDEAVRLSIRAGVDSLEHGYFISESSLEALASAGIPWVPTVIPVASQVRRKNLLYNHTPEETEVITKTYKGQLEMLKLAWEKGVFLGIGTDAGATGVPHGAGYLEELLLYQEAGLAPADILTIATRNNARILGLEDKLGAIKPGRPANFIAVEGNPLENLECLKHSRLAVL